MNITIGTKIKSITGAVGEVAYLDFTGKTYMATIKLPDKEMRISVKDLVKLIRQGKMKILEEDN